MKYLILLLTAMVFGADLPPEAARAVAAYDATVKEAEARFAKVKAEAAKICDGKLASALKAATQKGDLEAAMAIKTKKEEITPPPLEEKKGPVITVKKVVGTWSFKKGGGELTVVFNPDGTYTNQPGNGAGMWAIEGDKIKFFLGSNPARWNTINAADPQGPDSFSGDSWDHGANSAVAKKIK